MSRVALVNLSSLPMKENEPIFPLGVRCIEQALSSDGHEVVLIDFVERPSLVDDLAWASEHWDVVGFAIRNIDPIDLACDGHVHDYATYARKVCDALNSGVVLVGGGPGFGLFAETLTERLQLNVGVRGPGETAMIEVARNPRQYAGGRVVLTGKPYTGFISEVLSHPHSLMRAYSANRDAMIGVETRRKTCFQRCVYCPYAYITGESSGASKPINLLRDEISGIYEAGFRRIFFTDGIFNSGINYAKDVVRMVRNQAWNGLTWSAYFAARPFDDEFAKLLGQSGVGPIVVSPDSLDKSMMERLGKNFDLSDMDRFLSTCRRHGLHPMVNVVFGGPGETRQTSANTANYINNSLSADELSLHIGYRILPHTSLASQTGLPEGSLLDPTFYPFDQELFHWILSDLRPEFLGPDRLMNLFAGRSAARKMSQIAVDAVLPSHPANAAPTPVRALSRINLKAIN